MELWVFKGDVVIPKSYKKDVEELRTFIRRELDIYLSLEDVYKLWDAVSDSWSASWLNITAHYEGQTREEFLRYQIEKYCRRV